MGAVTYRCDFIEINQRLLTSQTGEFTLWNNLYSFVFSQSKSERLPQQHCLVSANHIIRTAQLTIIIMTLPRALSTIFKFCPTRYSIWHSKHPHIRSPGSSAGNDVSADNNMASRMAGKAVGSHNVVIPSK